jgi:hypothetical protein
MTLWLLGFAMGVAVTALCSYWLTVEAMPAQRDGGRRGWIAALLDRRAEPTAIRAVTPDELIAQRVGRETRR